MDVRIINQFLAEGDIDNTIAASYDADHRAEIEAAFLQIPSTLRPIEAQ